MPPFTLMLLDLLHRRFHSATTSEHLNRLNEPSQLSETNETGFRFNMHPSNAFRNPNMYS